jgi:AAA family ATP:ADP antiporter
MGRFLEKMLNLSPGDLGRGILFFFYLFLIIGSYTVGKVARDALFLDRFAAKELPYADIAIALLVGVLVAVYVRVGRNTSIRNLLVFSLVFSSFTFVLIWLLDRYYQPRWLYPALYIWVGMVFVLAPAQVWTLANYVLTTRQAKRMFAAIGGGGITGAIFGGYVSKHAVALVGAEGLLLAIALFLGICAVLVVVIWKKKQQESLMLEEEEEPSRQESPRHIGDSIKLIYNSTYLRSIAAVICLASLVTTMAMWQFRAIAQETLVEKNAMAAFFSNFYFYSGIGCLLVQLLLTSRLLRRFGLGPALFMVPVALTLGFSGVLIWGTLLAAALMKGSDNVLRYSIDKPTVELLYLPLPNDIKFQVKWFIDTVIWRGGDALAGVTLLVFANFMLLPARQISWVALVFLAAWLTAAALARKHYVRTLRDSIHQHRLETERALSTVLDRSATDMLRAQLATGSAEQVLYALNVLSMDRQPVAHPAVRGLLQHADATVRHKAVELLSAARDTSVLPQMEELLRDPDPQVRTEALLFLANHSHIDPLQRLQELGDVADYSIRASVVRFLARPGPTQNLETVQQIFAAMVHDREEGPRMRLEAARLLSELPEAPLGEVRALLADSDAQVVSETLRALGRARRRRYIPEMIELLGREDCAEAATEALACFGEAVVGTLRDHLVDPSVALDVRRNIPGLLVKIGTQSAQLALSENLLEGDTGLRFRILTALNKMQKAHPELELDKLLLESLLAAEIMGHYRSYQLLGTFSADLEAAPVAQALRESMKQEVERIFRLLALLHPNYDLHSAFVGLQSKSPAVHDNALEFLDNVLKPPVRDMLVPLLDGEVSHEQRIRLAARVVRTKVESSREAALELLASEDAWLKSCGAYAVGHLGLADLETELNACLTHPDPLLRETATQAKKRLAELAASKDAPGGKPAASPK